MIGICAFIRKKFKHVDMTNEKLRSRKKKRHNSFMIQGKLFIGDSISFVCFFFVCLQQAKEILHDLENPSVKFSTMLDEMATRNL